LSEFDPRLLHQCPTRETKSTFADDRAGVGNGPGKLCLREQQKGKCQMTTDEVKHQSARDWNKMVDAEIARRERAKEAMINSATAMVPAVQKTSLPAVPTGRSAVSAYLDEVAPASIVGRLIKFDKNSNFVTSDDNAVIADDVDFVALVDQTLIGWQKFNQEGPPDRVMGLLYDGFVMPTRESLGDTDPSAWDVGLDGKPADPWQHTQYLVLQRRDTDELFTYTTSSKTGRRAVGNLLRHCDRLCKTNPSDLPVVRLKKGGFEHKDTRIGWVSTPVFAVLGRAPRDSVAVPDTSTRADMDDEIPF
jgi:hypothetical protein